LSFSMQTGAMPTAVPSQGRQMPYYTHPDYRIYEFNKKLLQRTEECDNIWWDNLISEFFEDDAVLTIQFLLDDVPKKYSIGRILIPRYFRSLFEGGVSSVFFFLDQCKESFTESTVTLDCEKMTMVTHIMNPVLTKVFTEGHFSVEFNFDNLLRIRHWLFDIKQHQEMIPRSVLNSDDDSLEKISKNITRQGLTNFTMNYLRLCVILEPLQEMMSKYKAYNMSPRDCLKSVLYQKWQARIMGRQEFQGPQMERIWKSNASEGTQKPAPKRRKRRASTAANENNSKLGNSHSAERAAKRKASPISSNRGSVTTTDVMLVGEPTLMGGEFGAEDERVITRLENTQYAASNGVKDESASCTDVPASSAGSWPDGRKGVKDEKISE